MKTGTPVLSCENFHYQNSTIQCQFITFCLKKHWTMSVFLFHADNMLGAVANFLSREGLGRPSQKLQILYSVKLLINGNNTYLHVIYQAK